MTEDRKAAIQTATMQYAIRLYSMSHQDPSRTETHANCTADAILDSIWLRNTLQGWVEGEAAAQRYCCCFLTSCDAFRDTFGTLVAIHRAIHAKTCEGCQSSGYATGLRLRLVDCLQTHAREGSTVAAIAGVLIKKGWE